MIQVGDILPDFEAQDQEGNLFLWKERKGKPIVIYFYPRNFTPGCTQQACYIRDVYSLLKTKGWEIIGISSGTISSHYKFSKRHNLPFQLLVDKKKYLSKHFGVPSAFFGLFPSRVTYVIDENGRVTHILKSPSPYKHFELLEFLLND